MIVCLCTKLMHIYVLHEKLIHTEKGADFSGESVLQRKFVLEGPVTHIKVQLAFSSSDKREKKTALLLLQTENK